MNVRMMAAVQLMQRMDWAVKPIFKTYEGILTDEEKSNVESKGPAVVLYRAAERLCKLPEGHPSAQVPTLNSMAGQVLHREINKRLRNICEHEIPFLVPEIGGDSNVVLGQYTEGLVTEWEMLTSLILTLMG